MVAVFSWAAFITSLVLMIVKIWHFYDVYQDWSVAKVMDADHPVFRQARGAMWMAWLRVLDGVLWITLTIILLTSRGLVSQVSSTPQILRGLIFIMLWMEIAKVLTDRLTRIEVIEGIRKHNRRHSDERAS